MSFFKIVLKNISRAEEFSLSQFCFDFGADGLSEVLGFSQGGSTFSVEMIERDPFDVEVFFVEAPPAEFVQLLKDRWPQVEVLLTEEQERDWLEEWKKGYTAFSLVSDFWVVPSWEKAPETAKKIIWIDPGMAFGTGTHATTQLASELILAFPPQQTAIDVGTGTGILAMVARHHGYTKILGTEIDAEARRVARENLAINKMLDIEIPEEQVEQIHEQYDLVIANIIDGVLIHLKKALINVMKPQGKMILSGILEEREPNFLEKFIADDFVIERREQKEEWVSFLLSRKPL